MELLEEVLVQIKTNGKLCWPTGCLLPWSSSDGASFNFSQSLQPGTAAPEMIGRIAAGLAAKSESVLNMAWMDLDMPHMPKKMGTTPHRVPRLGLDIPACTGHVFRFYVLPRRDARSRSRSDSQAGAGPL